MNELKPARPQANQKSWWTHTAAKRTRGLTLIEVLTVLAIVMILVALSLVMVVSARRRATNLACLNNLKQLALSFRAFADLHEGQLPSDQSEPWYVQLASHGELPQEMFQCPAAPDEPAISYAWRDRFSVVSAASLSGRRMDLLADSNLILAFDQAAGWHASGSINAATIGGAVQSYTTDDFEENLLLSVASGRPFPLDE